MMRAGVWHGMWKVAAMLLLLAGVACGERFASSSPPTAVGRPSPTGAAGPTQVATLATAVTLPAPTQAADPVAIQPTMVGDPRAVEMRAFLADLQQSGRFMGSVLVARGGEILLHEGFGWADVAAGRANSPETQFRIGSLTKQFTAAAILQLQEQGLLSVQDPLATYLPGYPNGESITIQHLLTHTAGIPNYERRPDLPQVVQAPIGLDDLIASFSSQPLDFVPGSRYAYSSSGYVLLTKIIEVVSGQSYASYIGEAVLGRAGMTQSGYDFLAPELSQPATGYDLVPGGPQAAIRTDSSWPTGAGALYSTTGDLYRWDRALYNDSVLAEASRTAMFTPWVATGQGADYGYGWDIGRTAGRPSVAHGGGIFGFASYIARFPEDDAAIIVLSNGIQMPPRVVAEELAGMLFAQ